MGIETGHSRRDPKRGRNLPTFEDVRELAPVDGLGKGLPDADPVERLLLCVKTVVVPAKKRPVPIVGTGLIEGDCDRRKCNSVKVARVIKRQRRRVLLDDIEDDLFQLRSSAVRSEE